MAFETSETHTLLEVARASIHHGLARGEPLFPDVAAYPAPLRERRASFVTLQIEGRLRGCIGQLVEDRPLVGGVAHNAFSAAFRDRRFPPLRAAELDGTEITVSVLSAPEPLRFAQEHELLEQLRPQRDGLILREGSKCGTFLPSVWNVLPQAEAFWRELKCKAGLPPDYWSPTLQVLRYTTVSFSDQGGARAAGAAERRSPASR